MIWLFERMVPMNIRRLFALSAAAVCVTALAGCSGETPVTEPSAEAVTEQVQPDKTAPADTPADQPEQTATPLPIDLVCPDGQLVVKEDIAELFGEEGVTADTMTDSNWWSISVDKYAYMAEPNGICMSSFEGNFDQTAIPETADLTYKRVCPGDTFCGFKVTYAESDFASSGFIGGSAELEGTAEVTGWARKAPADDGYTMRGDIEFIIDSDSLVFPVMYFGTDENGGIITRIWQRTDGANDWVNIYPQFDLGSETREPYPEADISMLPDDGSYVCVRFTLDNIRLTSYADFSSMITATVVGAELL